MDFFISAAHAQEAAGTAAPQMFDQTFFFLIFMIIMMFFLIIRPQMKRNKEHKNMMGSLAKGDEVIIAGGVAGKVVSIGEVYMSLEIAEGVEIKAQKASVHQVLPKGTIKEL